MNKIILILETKINNIIRNLSGYEISIEVEKNSIKFNKKEKNDRFINVRKLCGYERIVFNVGLRLALNDMNTMTKTDFILIDEGFSAADDQNIQKITYLIDIIKKQYKICILISHIDEIKNQDGRLIKINYNNNTTDSQITI